jgi:hypothetical protein
MGKREGKGKREERVMVRELEENKGLSKKFPFFFFLFPLFSPF